MNRYRGFCLVDITNTGVTSYSTALALERNQQRNWETVLQLLSLRTQLHRVRYLGWSVQLLDQYYFGINYTGKHKLWEFEFSVDQPDPYQLDHDRYRLLKQDVRTTPVVLDLTETANPTLPFFFVDGADKNIYFKLLN